MTSKERLITRDFVFFLLAAGFIFLSGSMINTPLPKYILFLGGSGSMAGFVTGLFALSSCLLRPIFGRLLDNVGRLPVLLFGILLNTVIVIAYTMTDTISVLLVLRFLHGIALSSYSTAFGTITADLTPKDRIVEGYGYYSILQTVANSVGPVLGLGLVVTGNYQILFLLAAGVSSLGFASACLIRYERRRKLAQKESPSRQPDGSGQKKVGGFFVKRALAIMLTALFMAMTFGVVLTFISPLAAARGIGNIGIYFTFNAITVFLMRLFLGRLTNRLGTVRLILTAFVFLLASMAVLSVAESIPVFVIGAVLNGLGYGGLLPLLNSMAVRASSPDRKGAANATFYIGIDVGAGLGSVIGGLLADAFSYAAPFIASTVFALLAALVFSLVVVKQIRRYPEMDLAEPIVPEKNPD